MKALVDFVFFLVSAWWAKLMKVLFSSLKRLGALGFCPFWACPGHRVYLKHIS